MYEHLFLNNERNEKEHIFSSKFKLSEAKFLGKLNYFPVASGN